MSYQILATGAESSLNVVFQKKKKNPVPQLRVLSRSTPAWPQRNTYKVPPKEIGLQG